MAIYFDEIPNNIALTVGIAGKDEMIPFLALNEMTDKHNCKRIEMKLKPVKKIVWETLAHGDAITNKTCLEEIVDALSNKVVNDDEAKLQPENFN